MDILGGAPFSAAAAADGGIKSIAAAAAADGAAAWSDNVDVQVSVCC